MKFTRLFVFVTGVCFCFGVKIKEIERSEETVTALLKRLLGDNTINPVFSIAINPEVSTDGKLTVSLFKNDSMDAVRVEGSSGVAVAWGAYYYLRKFTSCHISWDGDQVNLPETLPNVNITIKSLDKWMYYQNVVTVSYSSIWWDWARWERELDWMALNGINLALAATAQEAIWRRVYDAFGIVHDEFTGPAFLAWNRMGNMRSFGGGLSEAWHTSQIELQHKILQRMKELGITPVLPAFSGFVPSDFKSVFPSANMTKLERWNGFADEHCCPDLLSFDDPLFRVVGREFLREYINEFGTGHIYNCDTFNEQAPGSKNADYLQAAARSIYSAMTEIDPEAVWMLQAWAFLNSFWGKDEVKAYLTAIPQGSFLILDLQADLTPLHETFDNFYGQPYIWCTLHNFGGQLGLFGHLERVNQGIVESRQNSNGTLIGLGIVPEGIGQNYVMYEFTLQANLLEEPINMTDWITDYVKRRYNIYDPTIDEAWQILRQTVYNYVNPIGKVSSSKAIEAHIEANILIKLPSLHLTEVMWYNMNDVFNAWQLLLTGASNLGEIPFLLSHDLIDVTRQIVQLAVSRAYRKVINNFYSNNEDELKLYGGYIKSLLNDTDPILKSGKNFLLGRWLDGARKAGSTPEEKIQYEWNARNQLTLWGPNGEIRDYAAKQWSGMMSDFYLPRWSAFVDALIADLSNGTAYNQTEFSDYIYNNIEQPFTLDTTSYPTEPVGDPLTLVKNFNLTWYDNLKSIFSVTREVIQLQPLTNN